MKTERLACNNCGAPLDVPESARFVKCNHCDANLSIQRTAQATFTEQIEQLNQTTDALRDQVESLTRQNELAAIDREWETQIREFMVSDKHGNKHLPTTTGSVVGGVFVVCFGLFWMVFAFGITSGSPFGMARVFPLFGLIFIAFGVFAAVSSYKKAEGYRTAKRRYRQRRAEVLRDRAARGYED